MYGSQCNSTAGALRPGVGSAAGGALGGNFKALFESIERAQAAERAAGR